jgi:hypothetical protein
MQMPAGNIERRHEKVWIQLDVHFRTAKAASFIYLWLPTTPCGLRCWSNKTLDWLSVSLLFLASHSLQDFAPEIRRMFSENDSRRVNTLQRTDSYSLGVRPPKCPTLIADVLDDELTKRWHAGRLHWCDEKQNFLTTCTKIIRKRHPTFSLMRRFPIITLRYLKNHFLIFCFASW